MPDDDFYEQLAHALTVPIPHRWIRDGLVIETDWRSPELWEVVHVEALYRRAVNPIDSGRLNGCTYIVRPVDTFPAQRCRHCGDLIVRRGPGKRWVHAHHLNRCQQPGRPYGYEARPPAPGECDCRMCQTNGQTSPADNTRSPS